MKDRYKETIDGLTDKELLFHLFATQILLLAISIILSWFLFDRFAELKNIFTWPDFQILTVGVVAGAAVVLADVVMMKFLPSSYYDDGGLNERIFQGRTIPQIAIIAAVVAFSEELLFRGIIQTTFGLIISSIIFAIVHYRYLFNWFLFLNIVLLSFLIGFIYMQTNNLLVTITMHFVIDFLLGLIIKSRTGSANGGANGE
ncbi:CPBP family intramembrane glutamic endopeptidase [Bacillus sp. REN3]|uniref:CPBP family intramembrane glutamic endopeptidase n=1 Tax=Bacillus sp. REN3 TaxID=2802440 RepID=UPI001AEEC494|nr:CPBP family intramembrane glutamic endopeptidase [Bacillus sp. REN3]